MMKNKSDAIAIVLGRGKPKDDEMMDDEMEDSEEESEASELELDAADELIKAVKSGDPESVIEAYKALRDACEYSDEE